MSGANSINTTQRTATAYPTAGAGAAQTNFTAGSAAPAGNGGAYLPGNAQPRNFMKNHFNGLVGGAVTAPVAGAVSFVRGAQSGESYQSASNDKHSGIVAGFAKDIGTMGGDLSNIAGDAGKILNDVNIFKGNFHPLEAIKDTFHMGGDSIKTAVHGAKTLFDVAKNGASDVLHLGNTIKRASWNTGATLRTLGGSGFSSITKNLQAGYASTKALSTTTGG